MTAPQAVLVLDPAEVQLARDAVMEAWEYTSDTEQCKRLLTVAGKLAEARDGITDPAAYAERTAELSNQVLGLAPGARELLLGYLAGLAPEVVERALAALPSLHKATETAAGR